MSAPVDKTSNLDGLIAEYDRVQQRRERVEADLRLDATGDRRAERVAAVAEAVRAGKKPPSYPTRAELQLELDGVVVAMEGIRAEMVADIGAGYEHPTRTPLPLTASGEAMAAAIERAFEIAERAHAVTQEKIEGRRRLEAVIQKDADAKFAWLQSTPRKANGEPICDRAQRMASYNRLEALGEEDYMIFKRQDGCFRLPVDAQTEASELSPPFSPEDAAENRRVRLADMGVVEEAE